MLTKYSFIFFIFPLIFAATFVVSGQDVVPLKIKEKPRPGYTDKARGRHTMGVVMLKVEFRSDGNIGTVTAVSELPDGLTEQAIAAARGIKFEPQLVGGSPATVVKTVEYAFSIMLRDDHPDIKTKLKIIKGPVFKLDNADVKALGRQTYKLEIHFLQDGTARLGITLPELATGLRSKIEQAVSLIQFEPSTLKDGRKVSISKTFDFNTNK